MSGTNFIDSAELFDKSFLVVKRIVKSPSMENVGVKKYPSTPCPKKGILKYSSMENVAVKYEDEDVKAKETFQKQQGQEVATNSNCKPKPLEWRKMRRYLLEAHFGEMSPAAFIQMSELWDVEERVYVCPHLNCNRKYFHRLDCVSHVLCRHFSTHNDFKVKPFYCRSCKANYRTIDDLIDHGETQHPRCHWLPHLKEVVNRQS